MQTERFNISKPREEAQKDGSTKTFWDNVGTLVIFIKDDGSKQGVLNLTSFDKSIKLNVFQFKPRTEGGNYSQPAPKDDYSQPEDYKEEEIKIENIPF